MGMILLNVVENYLLPIFTAALGGWVGAYLGNKYRENKESHEKEIVRNIAIKALKILMSYSKKSYKEAEGEFNNTMSIAEKRTIIVALHKLGVPFSIPSNEKFNIREIHFVDTVVNEDDINGIILQISKGYCDNLFYIDPDTYFASNFTLFAVRNVGKKYVSEVLSKSKMNPDNRLLTEPVDLSTVFSLGEFKAIQVLREKVNNLAYFDKNGQPIKEKIEVLLKEIDLGLWDSYLLWNYENYQSVMAQIQMSQIISKQQPLINPVPVTQREVK